MSAASERRRRGRPRKFAGPSRAVTLTLPEEVLARLSTLDADLSHAIVRLTGTLRQAATPAAAELAIYGRRAVITIRPTPAFERRVGIELIPLPNGRALISFDQPQTIAELELMLADALEDRWLAADERQVFESIRTILKDARRSSEVRLLRRNIIVLEYNTAPRTRQRQPTQRTGGRQSG